MKTILLVIACMNPDYSHCYEYEAEVWVGPESKQECRKFENTEFDPVLYQEPYIQTTCES